MHRHEASSRRLPAALLAAALIATTTLTVGCKPGDGAGGDGASPPSGTRAPDQAPPTTPRQP